MGKEPQHWLLWELLSPKAPEVGLGQHLLRLAWSEGPLLEERPCCGAPLAHRCLLLTRQLFASLGLSLPKPIHHLVLKQSVAEAGKRHAVLIAQSV